jgi:hypothetical protein
MSQDNTFIQHTSSVEYAKAYLQKTLSDPLFLDGLNTSIIMQVGKQYGLHRNDLKAARKKLGIISEDINGVQYWRLPRAGI